MKRQNKARIRQRSERKNGEERDNAITINLEDKTR